MRNICASVWFKIPCFRCNQSTVCCIAAGLEAGELHLRDGARGAVGPLLGPRGPARHQARLHPPRHHRPPRLPVGRLSSSTALSISVQLFVRSPNFRTDHKLHPQRLLLLLQPGVWKMFPASASESTLSRRCRLSLTCMAILIGELLPSNVLTTLFFYVCTLSLAVTSPGFTMGRYVEPPVCWTESSLLSHWWQAGLHSLLVTDYRYFPKQPCP